MRLRFVVWRVANFEANVFIPHSIFDGMNRMRFGLTRLLCTISQVQMCAGLPVRVSPLQGEGD
jgi:hypothetical protein